MCGIGGFVSASRAPLRGAGEALSGALRHRGPDDAGHLTSPLSDRHSVDLVHRRLAILDLSAAGHQPMVNRDTGDALVYNGEIYNYRELRQDLEGTGQEFDSQTDTEVILRGYAVWGRDILSRLQGMFAFALVDARRGEVLLARDPLGIKPLYYAAAPDSEVPFAFSSEVRALLASGLVARHVSRAAVEHFLINGFVPDPLTIIGGVLSVLPGHYVRLDGAGRVCEYRSFEPEPVPQPVKSSMTRQEAAQVVRMALEDAIDRHLMSDVPLGAFLSGGIDSSIVSTLMARRGAEHVRTFSLVFDDPTLSEERFSRAVANHLGTAHSECRVTEQDFLSLADDGLGALDQPSTDGLNTYVVSRKCREAGLTSTLR